MWDKDLILLFGGSIAVLLTVRLTGAFSAWVKHRASGTPDLRAMRQRIDEIGAAVETIAVEVERISEAQRFTAQLLAGRAGAPDATERPRVGPPPTA